MTDRNKRRELKDAYRENPPEAGVYRIMNQTNGRWLLGSSANLPSVGNKFTFARASGSPGALDRRIQADVVTFGVDAFSVDVLELFEIAPGATDKEIRDDLAVLESLWREKLDPSLSY
jgi:hypothetical protein